MCIRFHSYRQDLEKARGDSVCPRDWFRLKEQGGQVMRFKRQRRRHPGGPRALRLPGRPRRRAPGRARGAWAPFSGGCAVARGVPSGGRCGRTFGPCQGVGVGAFRRGVRDVSQEPAPTGPRLTAVTAAEQKGRQWSRRDAGERLERSAIWTAVTSHYYFAGLNL